MIDSLVHVTRLDQAELMRQIRNSCREFMTNDRNEITPEQQIAWFNSIKDSEDVLPFLFSPRVIDGGRNVVDIGYGLLRKTEWRWWLSGGLLPEWRGRGYGFQLFGELAEYVHDLGETAWLTVWEHNQPAMSTYLKLGFRFESAIVDPYQPPILVMRLDPAPTMRMHKLVCPICGKSTNRTRSPSHPTGVIANHPSSDPTQNDSAGFCFGSGALLPWVLEEVQ